MKSDRRKLFEQLRHDYPEFTYDSFSYEVNHRHLQVKFNFQAGDKYFFSPEHKIPLSGNFDARLINNSRFRKKIFNLGMVEMISYWKAVCSPKIIIRAGMLDKDQIAFWTKLFHHGLGEFFYLNGLQADGDLLRFYCHAADEGQDADPQQYISDKVLVPVGGGKDSTVTLEILKERRECIPFIMNPRGASLATSSIAGYSANDIVCSTRSIDKNLLLLNEKGYLNGHTPFSAVLAFTTLLVASLHGCNEIALSNESSANEPNLPGTRINHQYSKSFEFENDFREYVSNYIDPSIAYYSFLRPLNELQIGGLFSDLTKHHQSFRSCNVGSKTDSWCGHCPKCLFTFIILSPFISYNELVSIFGKDLLDDTSLSNTLDQLTGIAKEKPFECVGTINEVNLAMQLLIRNSPEKKPALLLHYIEKHGVDQKNFDKTLESTMHQFDANNITSSEDVSLLKKKLHDIRY